MEERQFSEEQIHYLHNFAKKKDIVFVDLRIELVDHICGLMQERWVEYPNDSFKDCFHAVYKSFGIFGFSDIAAKHQRVMGNRYFRELSRYFLGWVRPPQVVLTLVAYFMVYYTLGSFSDLSIWLIALTGLVWLISVLSSIVLYRRNLRILGERNVLMSGVFNGFYWFFYFSIEIVLFGSNALLENDGLLSFVFMFTLIFGLANYSLLNKAEEQLLQIKEKALTIA